MTTATTRAPSSAPARRTRRIARRSRGSIRLRERDANPLDRGESASRARATARARVVGPGNRGIGLCKKARKRREENSESAAN